MHRQILVPGYGQEVDHINRNPLDNRRANLRLCARSENAHNQGKHRDNTSGYKGVFAYRPGMWRARIMADGAVHHLGVFVDPVEAALAYDRAAIELHGSFAHLNFLEA